MASSLFQAANDLAYGQERGQFYLALDLVVVVIASVVADTEHLVSLHPSLFPGSFFSFQAGDAPTTRVFSCHINNGNLISTWRPERVNTLLLSSLELRRVDHRNCRTHPWLERGKASEFS